MAWAWTATRWNGVYLEGSLESQSPHVKLKSGSPKSWRLCLVGYLDLPGPCEDALDMCLCEAPLPVSASAKSGAMHLDPRL